MLSIIGCGNSNRSDDGAGVYVVAQLKSLLGDTRNEDIRIFDAGTAGMEVMFQAKGSDALIIIDANSSNSEPGAIFEVPGEVLETCPEPQYNLHDFRWNHAIYAGRKIFREDFPKEITVYLIEAENLSFGLDMSDKIKDAADKVVEKIIAKLKKQTVSVRNGNLYIDYEVCQKFFPGIETIALLKRAPGFLVMPVFSQSSGGRLLKLRNSKGDRVVTATDFLHDLGISYQQEQSFKVTWESESAALVVDLTNAKENAD